MTQARRALLIATMCCTLAPLARAQDAATIRPAAPAPVTPAPATTQAATRPATEAERAEVTAYAAAATDVPQLKRVFLNRDGSPRPDFGQADPGFLNAHERFLERGKQPCQVLFLGDSITAGWARQQAIWDEAFGKYQPANFGIGGDRTQHVLWRIANGELDTIRPKVVVLMIGTNNGYLPAEEIAKGTTACVAAIRAKLPEAKVLLLGIFPRSARADDAIRLKLKDVNATLAKLADGDRVRYFEIWDQFLEPDGTLTRETMPDLLHLSAKGYRAWADAITPVLADMTK